MPAAVAQEVGNETNSSVTTLAQTITGVVSGSAILAFTTCDAGSGTPVQSVADAVTGFTLLDVKNDTIDQQFVASFILANASAGSHVVTVTNDTFRPATALWLIECSGVDIAPLDGHSPWNEQATPGMGTDGLTATTTNSRQPGLKIAFSFRPSAPAAPAAGTGFNSTRTAWNFTTGNQARSENLRVTSGFGSLSATFTAAANSLHETTVIFLSELGSSGAGSGSDVPRTALNVWNNPNLRMAPPPAGFRRRGDRGIYVPASSP